MEHIFPGIKKIAAGCLLAFVLLGTGTAAFASEADWSQFKQSFIEPDGRVVDTAQGGISHSEGQGYAMLLAVHYGDHALFEQLWQWTRKNLQVRDDSLLSWRWTPHDGIADKNNASDGDLLVAWALLRAASRFHEPEYRQAGLKIAQDIRGKLLRNAPQGLVLLPGTEGFDKPEGVTVNLSYWVFPALDEIRLADPVPQWDMLIKTGMDILQYARFGRWGLPPDWLILTAKVVPSNGFPEQFGYNAVRIPLYLLWSRRESPALLKPYQDFWNYFKGAKFTPSWTSLKDDSVDSYDASEGMHRIAQWVLDYPSAPSAPNSRFEAQQGYYASVLFLLTEMAMSERAAAR